MLRLLAGRAADVVTRDELLNEVWGYERRRRRERLTHISRRCGPNSKSIRQSRVVCSRFTASATSGWRRKVDKHLAPIDWQRDDDGTTAVPARTTFMPPMEGFTVTRNLMIVTALVAVLGSAAPAQSGSGCCSKRSRRNRQKGTFRRRSRFTSDSSTGRGTIALSSRRRS